MKSPALSIVRGGLLNNLCPRHSALFGTNCTMCGMRFTRVGRQQIYGTDLKKSEHIRRMQRGERRRRRSLSFCLFFFWVRIQQEIDGFNSFPSKDRRLYQPPTSTTDQTKVKTPAREAVMEPPCADTGTHQMGWHVLLPHGQGHGRTHQMEMGWHMLLAHGQGPSRLLHPGLGCFAASPVPHHRSPLMEEGRGHPTTTSSRRQPRHFP
jgi:hypothetical protein